MYATVGKSEKFLSSLHNDIYTDTAPSTDR